MADEPRPEGLPVPSSPNDPGSPRTLTPQNTDIKTLEERLIEALKGLVQSDQLPKARAAVRQVVIEEHFGGPIPHPQHFEHYNRVVPGAADRILAMAEKEQSHRHKWETRHLNWDIVSNLGGLICGFLVALALVVAAV